MQSPFTIGVIGMWHLGEIYSAGLAELGHTVVGIDEDATRVEKLNTGTPPLPEPGLEKLLSDNIQTKRLRYTTDYSVLKDCGVVWLTIDTLVMDNDEVDTSTIFSAVDSAIPHLQENVVFVVSSQLPVGTSENIMNRVRELRPELSFEYAYTPENLRLGEAVKCFLNPVRVIVGASSERAVEIMRQIFSTLSNPAEIIPMAPASAEMGKHALNTFLSAEISFANDLADIAERVGADMLDVTRMLKSDPRIGPKAYLDAGVSFSGGTLNRDVKILTNLVRHYAIQPSIIESIYLKNESRKGMIVEKLLKDLGTLQGKTVTLLGLTYKPGTKTLRRSYPLEVAQQLMEKGVMVRLHDPVADEGEIGLSGTVFSRDTYNAVSGADAIVVLTTCSEFRDLDFKRLYATVKPRCVFFDPNNFLALKEKIIIEAGFIYRGVGRVEKVYSLA